jgi:hypothetical protein
MSDGLDSPNVLRMNLREIRVVCENKVTGAHSFFYILK